MQEGRMHLQEGIHAAGASCLQVANYDHDHDDLDEDYDEDDFDDDDDDGGYTIKSSHI